MRERATPFLSIRYTVILFFTAAVLAFIAVVSAISTANASRQLERAFRASILDMVLQTRSVLNRELSSVARELYDLTNERDTFAALIAVGSYGDGAAVASRLDALGSAMKRVLLGKYDVLDSVVAYFNEGRIDIAKTTYGIVRKPFDFAAWQARHTKDSDGYSWSNLHRNEFFDRSEGAQEVLSVARVFGSAASSLRGVIAVNIRQDFLVRLLGSAYVTRSGYLGIVSQDGIATARAVPEALVLERQEQARITASADDVGTVRLRSGTGALSVVLATLLPPTWKLVAVFPDREMAIDRGSVWRGNLYVFLVLVATVTFLYVVLTRTITRPMGELAVKVGRLEQGDLDVVFDVCARNEIGVLNEGLESSVKQVRRLLGELEARKEHEKQTDLDLLQSQIKPHFLYNTLQSIKQLCDMGRTSDASSMVTSFAQFCRLSLAGGGREVTVADEIRHVEAYLRVQQMRYGGVFTYELSVDPPASTARIVRFTVQPLVENAIYHGVKSKRGESLIRISGWVEGGDAWLEVWDNGAGISEERLERLRIDLGSAVSGAGIGLVNAHERLRLCYGEPYGISVQSRFGEWTSVRVRVPARGALS